LKVKEFLFTSEYTASFFFFFYLCPLLERGVFTGEGQDRLCKLTGGHNPIIGHPRYLQIESRTLTKTEKVLRNNILFFTRLHMSAGPEEQERGH
jgi:hypothetical protein